MFSLVWLTNWGWVLILIHFTLAVYISTLRRRDLDAAFDWTTLPKASFHAFELALTLSFVVTIMYWTVVYNPSRVYTSIDWYLNVCMHSFNMVLMVIELMLGKNVLQGSHVYRIFALGILYGIVNFIYVTVDGSPLYNVLSWKSGNFFS